MIVVEFTNLVGRINNKEKSHVTYTLFIVSLATMLPAVLDVKWRIPIGE
jgi:hypothetical protein